MLDLEDCATVVELRKVSALIGMLHYHIDGVRQPRLFGSWLADVGHKAGREWHGLSP